MQISELLRRWMPERSLCTQDEALVEEFVTRAGNLEEELFATRDSEVTDDEKWNSRLIANTRKGKVEEQ